MGDSNGLEVWRQLHALYVRKTKVRSMAILSAIMGFPAFTKERTLLEQVQMLERLGDEYQRTSGTNISDNILLTTLVRALPRAVQQHIQLGMTNATTYQEVKGRVVAYERISNSWTRDKILTECGANLIGAVTSYAGGSDSGPAPMEVNLVQKGKGKKGKSGDKGKGKNKGSYGTGKGKGKNYGSGKGKSQNKGYDSRKGQQKGQGNGQQYKQKLDINACAYCGKTGHWQRDCLKKKADQQQQVRQVGEQSDSKRETAFSTASMSTGSGSQAIRLLSVQTCSNHTGHVEDLTIHSVPTSPCSSHRLRMVGELKQFDMAASDSNGSWTLSPSYSQHLRAVTNVDVHESCMDGCDVILDSGEDTQVPSLSLKYVCVCVAGPKPDACFVDAQGAPLTVEATRLANIQFGDVTFRDRFIISDVTCPLLSLGNVLRAGWSVVHVDGVPFLTKGDKQIEVLFKNNSLCARGQASVVSELDAAASKPAVRVVELGMALRRLVPGWNRINPHLYAIRTTAPQHVNTTLCPAAEMMWLRTTVFF